MVSEYGTTAIEGESGNFANVNDEKSLLTNDYLVEVGKGNFSNADLFVMRGRNASIDLDETTDIWDYGGDINQPSSDETLYISSTNVGDNQTIIVDGLDADYHSQLGIATLNGQNQVEVKSLGATAITYIRFFQAINNGTTELAGDVYVATSDTLTGGVPDTASKIYGKIIIGNERTFNAFYTVPEGKIALTVAGQFSVNRGKDVLITPQGKVDGGVWVSNNPFDVFESNISETFPLPPSIPEKTDLKFKITANNNDTQVGVRVDFLVIDNTEENQAAAQRCFQCRGFI